jgi:predicted small metal-binding protein
MSSIKCKDCGFELKDENQDELIKILALHDEITHNLKFIPSDVMEKIKNAIKDNE